jgi:hypothetical protein
MNTLKIAYCNVRGLNDTCFNSLISYIHNQNYDIIVASETWFLNQHRYKSHSFYLQESIPLDKTHTTRRQDGGLLLLASPTLTNLISITSVTQYSITIKMTNSNERIAFVYYPPSLSTDSIQSDLQAIGHIDCLIGDINIRLGPLSGDRISNASQRKNIINNHISQYHLRYVRNKNENIVSRTDHVFSNINQLQWTYDKPNFNSDHQIMSLSFQTTSLSKSHVNLGTKRFDLKPLYNKIFQNEFINIYETEYGSNLLLECESALDFCCHSMILPTTQDTQAIIDITYDHLLDTIRSLLDKTLPSYNAQAVKSKPDSLLMSCNQPITNSTTIRCYKRWQRSMNANTPIISVDPTKTPLEECKSHYENQFTSNEPIPLIERQNDVEFGLLFTENDIKERISSYSNTKSIGPDNIHTLVWKSLIDSKSFLRSLSILFQIFASTSLVPSPWSTATLHLLKKDLNNPIASATRPIALCDILRRIFEKLLLHLWMKEEDSWTRLDYGQAGFRKGYSTLSHLILSDELSRRNTKYSIFLDIKSAFDSISWSKLNDVLLARHCPATHRNLILSLICKPASLLLSVNHSECVTIHTKKGVFQGGGISAFIFTLYIDPLSAQLNETSLPHQPLALLFADDVQIKATNELDAQRALDICTHYGQEYNLKWNLRKCATVSNHPHIFMLDNQQIRISNEYNYLGIIHKATGLDLRKTYTLKSQKQSNLLTSLLDLNWHPKVKLNIYRTFIRPITEYTIVLTYLWALKHPSRSDLISLMKLQHQTALKWIFNRKRYLKILDFLSGFGPWEHRMECLRAGLTRSLQSMSTSNPLTLARTVFLLSSSSSFVLQDCFRSSYWSEYQKLKTANPSNSIQFQNWTKCKLKALTTIASKSSALISYLNFSRSSHIKHFFNLDHLSFLDVLAWRLNHCFTHCLCLCGSAFRRTHTECILESNPLYTDTLHSLAYTATLSAISTSIAANFTVLDYLLNRSDFSSFLTLLSSLRSTLA